jgi:hypothetical protein
MEDSDAAIHHMMPQQLVDLAWSGFVGPSVCSLCVRCTIEVVRGMSGHERALTIIQAHILSFLTACRNLEYRLVMKADRFLGRVRSSGQATKNLYLGSMSMGRDMTNPVPFLPPALSVNAPEPDSIRNACSWKWMPEDWPRPSLRICLGPHPPHNFGSPSSSSWSESSACAAPTMCGMNVNI